MPTSKFAGKYYFAYTQKNWDEVTFFNDGIEEIKIPLDSITETDAIAEAKQKWALILANANEKWKETSHWDNPPKTAFGGVEPNPRVIYEIRL